MSVKTSRMSQSGAAFGTLPDRRVCLKAVRPSLSLFQAPWLRLESTSTTHPKFGQLSSPCGRNTDASDTRIAELHYAPLTLVLGMAVSTVRSMYASREIAMSTAVGTSACAAVLDEAADHTSNEQGALSGPVGEAHQVC
jgi:hypothetical protein